MTTATRIPIRLTVRIKCPCGASYTYPDSTGPDRTLYDAWTAHHAQHWGDHT